jgi:4-diphosphocytidyl-2-C-methyl-D-erythritol kinase
MAAGRQIVVEAPAKVNLYLGVGGLRRDGYHEVETVLHAVDLVDRLLVGDSESFAFSCESDLGIPPDENLVSRAALLFARHLGREPNVRLELAKAIPAGAGLGGGSSDAAATLAGLAEFWEAGEREELLDVASQLGADVPFFLAGGTGTGLFEGRGEVPARTLEAPALDIVLLKGRASIGTAEAYAEFDRDPVPPGSVDALVVACDSGRIEAIAAVLSNNMERAAVNLVPEVGDALAYLQSTEGVLGSCVAGSGSAVFGICADADVARRTAGAARADGWWSAAARSFGSGVRIRRMKEAR